MVKPSLFMTLLLIATSSTQATDHLTTTTAKYRDSTTIYHLDGVVEAINQSTIAAQTAGQVERILFDVDDVVKEGDLIVQLRSTEQKAQLIQAEAEVKNAAAHLAEAQDEYRRIKGVFKKALVSQSSMDKAETSLKAAKATHDIVAAGVEQAREQLQYTRIHAPYSGIVTKRHIEIGEIATPGQPLISGQSLDQLRVSVDIPQSLISAVRSTGNAQVHLDSETSLEITDLTIFPFADPKTNTFRVRLELPKETQSLFPGMFVKTSFATGQQKQLVVPSSSVVYRSEVTAVYIINSHGAISFRHIRTGNKEGRIVVVLAGLDAGEQVALNPIAAGAALKNQRAGSADE